MSQNKKLLFCFIGLFIIGLVLLNHEGQQSGLTLGGLLMLASWGGLIWLFFHWIRHRNKHKAYRAEKEE